MGLDRDPSNGDLPPDAGDGAHLVNTHRPSPLELLRARRLAYLARFRNKASIALRALANTHIARP